MKLQAGQPKSRVRRWLSLPISAFSVCFQLILDHINHDIVAHETSLVHDLLGFSSQRCLFGDLRSKHVTSSLQGYQRGVGDPGMLRFRTRWQMQYFSLMRGACVPFPVGTRQ